MSSKPRALFLNRSSCYKTASSLAGVVLAVLFLAAGFGQGSLASNKPIDWDKRLAKARQLMDTNNVEEAMKILSDELKKHPEAAAPHTDLGKAYKKRGKMMLAKSEFRRATEVDPSYAEAWYELGAMEQADKEFELAVRAFERFLQMQPYSDRKATVEERIRACKSNL